MLTENELDLIESELMARYKNFDQTPEEELVSNLKGVDLRSIRSKLIVERREVSCDACEWNLTAAITHLSGVDWAATGDKKHLEYLMRAASRDFYTYRRGSQCGHKR